MGIFRSKIQQQPDDVKAMENYTKELGEKYEALNQKIEDIAQFESKLLEYDKAFKDYKTAIQRLLEDGLKLKTEQDFQAIKYKDVESNVKEQKDILEKLEEEFAEKIDSYEESLSQSHNNIMSIEKKISRLSKEVEDHDQMSRIFKLNNISRSNGIKKATKDTLITKSHPQSMKKSPPSSIKRSNMKNKFQTQQRTRKNFKTDEDEFEGQENEDSESLFNENFMVAEDKLAKEEMMFAQRNKRVFEELDLNKLAGLTK